MRIRGFRRSTRSALAAACLLAVASAPVRAAGTYYFAASGNDASDCQSLTSPCRSLERLNSLPQLPGTIFLLHRGDRFPGEIMAQGSGSPGQPVTFAAYGDGPPPVIEGGLPVDSWTLASQGASAWIWTADVPQEANGQPFALVLDNRALPLARFPDTGFAKVASADSGSLILDLRALARPLDGIAGAEVWVRAQRRILSSRTVRSFDSATGRLTWDEPLPKALAAGAGVFISDAPGELDRPGEWFCHPAGSPPPRDGHRLRLALAPYDAPSAHSIRIANAGYGIKGSGLSHVRIAGLGFENQVSAAVYLYDCSQAEVVDCRIRSAILTGIDFRGSGLVASGNAIEGAALAGISARPDPDLNPLETAETGARITGNRIARIGLFSSLSRPGPDEDGERGIGILALGDGDHISDNRIDSTACDGIRFLGKRDRVEGNLLRKTCLLLDEGGALHLGPAQGPWGSEGSSVRGNLILSAPGSAAGTAGNITQAYGIFLDEKTADAVVEGNFVSDADVGVCIRHAHGHLVTGNVLYGNRAAPLRDSRAPSAPGKPEGSLYQNNIFWTLGSGGSVIHMPPLPAETACPPESGSACPIAGVLGNLACVESETSAYCDAEAAAHYPGGTPALLAGRFREFAKLWNADAPEMRRLPAAMHSLLPVSKPQGP